MLRWPVGIYRVEGESMLPTYAPTDTLIGWRWYTPRVGDVVVAMRDRPLIKRITRIESDQIWLEGDNPGHSTDSRSFGPLERASLRAKILFKI